MKRLIPLLVIVSFFFGCKQENKEKEIIDNSKNGTTKLRFLDEYIFPGNYKFKNTLIGGLSGIDFANKIYYIVADDSRNPRIYKADINIKAEKIDTIIFRDVINFDKKNNQFYLDNHLDLEGIVVEEEGIIVSSEGRINSGANPTIFKIDSLGNYKKSFELPQKFLANSVEEPRNNGVFEGLSRSHDKKGYWSAIEFPLTSDGEEPTYPTANSPVRFTYFNAENYQPTKEFLYELSPLPREKKGFVNLNGLTDILEYKRNHFLIIERTYQSGYKGNENIIRIFEASIENTTTDVLKIPSVKKTKYSPMKKQLIFDFSDIKSKLTNKIIDNIEGITFGPTLPNGNRTLIFVSDDNFQAYGKQLNQFLLFEIVE